MRKIFQIVFCILAALSVVAAFLMGAFWDFPYVLIGVAAALFFLILTLLMKYGNPFRRERKEPHADFMNSEEENARIRMLEETQHPQDEEHNCLCCARVRVHI